MRYTIIRWAVLTVAIGITAWLYSGITISGGIGSLIFVAALFGLVNAFVRPLIALLTCPLIILTLGLFTLFINTAMLLLTDRLTSALTVNDFWSAFWASLMISIISAILTIFVGGKEDAVIEKEV
ncbi:MAG: phage holin family protein [Chloroflexota bacterium]